MEWFNKYFKKNNNLEIVAMADGEIVDITTVSDSMFAEEMMGRSLAFKYDLDRVVLCSPADGILSSIFPTGHAFGITMDNGMELLVHCGIDTVSAKGVGFNVLSNQQGKRIKKGEPIVEVDLEKLTQEYDMVTLLIITNQNDQIASLSPQGKVLKGEKVVFMK